MNDKGWQWTINHQEWWIIREYVQTRSTTRSKIHPKKKATSFCFKHLQQVLHNRRTSMFGCQVQRSWTQAVCFVLISSRFYEGTYHIQMSMPSENPTDPQNGIPPNCFNCFNWWFFGITERVEGEILVFRKIRGLFIFSSSMQEPRLLVSFRMYDEQDSTYASSYDVSTRTTSMILEEGHHLGCIKPCKRDKLPISWYLNHQQYQPFLHQQHLYHWRNPLDQGETSYLASCRQYLVDIFTYRMTGSGFEIFGSTLFLGSTPRKPTTVGNKLS